MRVRCVGAAICTEAFYDAHMDIYGFGKRWTDGCLCGGPDWEPSADGDWDHRSRGFSSWNCCDCSGK